MQRFDSDGNLDKSTRGQNEGNLSDTIVMEGPEFPGLGEVTDIEATLLPGNVIRMSFLDEAGNAHEIAFDAYSPRQDLDLVGSGLVAEHIAKLTQHDAVAGTGGIDRIFSDNGSDTVDGFGGDDVIFGADGEDRFSGGEGDDLLSGEGGDDVLEGGAGSDTLRGGEGDDVLSGGNGDDSLTGGTGEDSLDGGAGDDILFGGEGSDVFLFNTEEVRLDDGTVVDATAAPLGFGRDVITDFELGADKIDLRKVAGVSSFVDEDLRISDTEGGALIEIGESSILLEGVDADNLTQGDFLFDQTVVMEHGSLSVGGDFVTVDLDTSFENPVVLAFVDGVAQPGIITTRLRNVENDSFEIRLQASDGDDPDLVQERVDYVVVEAGTHVLGNGAVLEAGLVSTDKVRQSTLREGVEKVDLTADFGGDAPAVFSTLNTYNGRDFTTTRVTNATGDGFDVAMAELEANTEGHVLEDIAFLAISTGTFGDLTVDMLEVGGSGVISGLDVDLAHVSHIDGLDPAVVRREADTGRLFMQEDDSFDAEVGHTTDLVSLLDFTQADGFLFA